VSEEVGPTSNEDDVDFDFESDVGVDTKGPVKTSSAEHDHVDDLADSAHLPVAVSADFQYTSSVEMNPKTNDQVTVAVLDKASVKNDESQTSAVSHATDSSLQTTQSVPDKPLAVDSMSDSKSDLHEPVEVDSVSASSRGLCSSTVPVADTCTTDIRKSEISQHVKKSDCKSVSMCLCVSLYVWLNVSCHGPHSRNFL